MPVETQLQEGERVGLASEVGEGRSQVVSGVDERAYAESHAWLPHWKCLL